jgi:dinuclear metal center YbgI/SA1388 family protein
MSSKSLTEIVQFLDDILLTSTTPDYPTAFNGLQLANRGSVTKIAAAVDFSSQAIKAAIAEKADLMIVHHGMFWAGVQPLVGPGYARLRQLLDADIAVYSSHLPLDRHPQVGNNTLLAKALGLDPSQEFAHFKDISIGVQGSCDIDTATLIERARHFSQSNGGNTIVSPGLRPDQRTRRWAICTGAGASAETLTEAAQHGIDTLIVGEGAHWTAVEAMERGIIIIYLGHYASETLGVQALAAEVARHFELAWTNISAPTGL